MPCFFGNVPADFHIGKIVLALLVDMVHDGLLQGFLVSFQSQNIVRFAVDNRRRNRFLSAHGVNGDDAAFDVHELQKLRNRGDFVRFLRTRYLSQRQTVLAGPHRHRMQGA